MLELVKKDFGLCRHVLAGGVIALLVPYLSVIIYTACTSGLTNAEGIEFFSLSLLAASQTSFWLSVLSIAFLGGFVVAGERRERSMEFLAFLPPSKSSILLSKAIVCFAWIVIVAITYFVVTDWIVPWASNGKHVYEASARDILLTMAIVFSVFGTSWFFSTLLTSPVFAVVAGLVMPYGLSMVFYVLQLYLGWELEEEAMRDTMLVVHLLLGVLTFAGGWFYFTKRIEP